MKRFPSIFFVSVLLGVASVLVAHEKEGHDTEQPQLLEDDDGFEVISSEPSVDQLRSVNARYLKQVKPVFKKKCLDCHGTGNPLPWYSKIPGPKNLIEKDIREARKHMDMTKDIPFSGHGTLKDDLTAIERIIQDGSMPPLRYRIMHWGSRLTEDNKNTIQKWIEDSRLILNESKHNKKEKENKNNEKHNVDR